MPKPDYCAYCLAEWMRLPKADRLVTKVPQASTTIRGIRTCATCCAKLVNHPSTIGREVSGLEVR